MRRRHCRIVVTLAFGAALACVALSASAWACIPQPMITLQPRASGPPGSRVKVSGLNYGDGTVELRWNAMDGERLQTARGPVFETDITVPAVPAGLYVVLGIPRTPDGSVTGTVAVAAFDVVADGAAGATPSVPQAQPHSGHSDALSVTATSAVAGGLSLVAIGLGVGILVSRRRQAVPSA